jgi:hypothetical protein
MPAASKSTADGGLQVIGAGFGRCGTTSLRAALRTLGYDPCYHMQTALTHYPHLRFWIRARAGEPVDYRRFFRRYRAAVDWPVCEFYRDLMALYPDAKVVLNVRDPGAWYDSVRDTLWVIDQILPWWFPSRMRQMHDDVIWNGRFQGRFLDRSWAIEVYQKHLADVRSTVPPERLLEFDVRQGWQPLCAFLDRPVPPNVPFPRLNDRRWFRRVLLALRLAEWLVPALLLAVVAWLGLSLH